MEYKQSKNRMNCKIIDFANIVSGEEFTVGMGNSACSYSNTRLHTYGLVTCIGLAVVSKNFAFLAHLDMGGLIGNSFDQVWIPLDNGKYDIKSTKCIATEQLMDAIRKGREHIMEPLNVQLIYGYEKSFTQNEQKERMKLLCTGLNNVFELCQNLGITVNRIPDGISRSVTVDSKSGSILLGDEYGEYFSQDSEIPSFSQGSEISSPLRAAHGMQSGRKLLDNLKIYKEMLIEYLKDNMKLNKHSNRR